jgi:hypothetical protein
MTYHAQVYNIANLVQKIASFNQKCFKTDGQNSPGS